MSSEGQTVQVTKTMLIIKSDEKSLRGVEQFLRNRDWQLRSTHQLKDAILFLVQSKPSFVLIAVDHPNRKVRKLPKVIAAAFPTCVMLFAEKSSTASFKTLIDSGAEYKINPPITGPAVERAVNKYIRDLEQAAKQKNHAEVSGSEKNAYEFMVEIKSARGREPALLHLQSETSEGQNILTGTGSADEIFLQQNSMAQVLLAQLGLANGGGDISGNTQESLPPAASRSLPVVDEEKSEAQELYVPPQSSKVAPTIGPPSASKEKPDANLIYAREVEEGSKLPPKNPIIEESSKRVKTKPGGIFEEDSIFVRGVSESLDETVVKGASPTWQPLDENSHVACLLIKAQRFSGYLVAALAQDKKIDESFMELIRSRLAKFLRENGDPIEDQSNLQLQIKRVNFEAWALEQAEFLKKSLHQGDEVAMAFFPFADVKNQVGESAHQSMVSVSIQEVESNISLEFNLYLYLAANRKYILYTPVNGILYAEQKERLLKGGLERFHIAKTDVEKLSKFKAQNRLNALIDLHHKDLSQVKKSKKKAS